MNLYNENVFGFLREPISDNSKLSDIYKIFLSILLIWCFTSADSIAQITNILPLNTATHTAIQNGSWFEPNTWDSGTVPSDAAIVVIPQGIQIEYLGCSDAHIFAIRVDGQFTCRPKSSSGESCIRFDSFICGHMSEVKIVASNPLESIDITIDPFDIEAHKQGVSGYTQEWNQEAMAYYSDGAIVYEVISEVQGDRRYNTIEEAIDGDTEVVELSRTVYNDGIGVTGRYMWDSGQHSLGFITMGQLEIIGSEKKTMTKLSEDAIEGEQLIQLESIPSGWQEGDPIIITRDGILGNGIQAEDYTNIQSIDNQTISLVDNLEYNHQGIEDDSLHCYVGNLKRNITFRSAVKSQIHQRGHMMAMHNNENIQIRNAAFIDMGRTDKSRLIDDFVWDRWIEPNVFKSKISPLGQEVCQMKSNPIEDVTNIRGRYSIHLHKTGAKYIDNMVYVTGNVIMGNPGWGITHHDSYATVSDNVVVDVTGAGIVSESGSELGFWDNNLVVDIKKGHNILDPYDAAVFHDDLLFSGQGLAMKGRGVVCRNNVIVAADQGVGVINLNPSISNHDRVDPKALASFRPNHEFDQFPLSQNGYSKEGDGVMPVEVSLIMENTTIIDAKQGLRSIERDMGLNHESRSVFDGLKIWGAKQGLSINYQADYSFRDVYISGFGNNTIGIVMWKHSHNQTYENIKLVDLDYGVQVSQLVESGNGLLKTRNNGFTPWIFIDLDIDNVNQAYLIQNEDPDSQEEYLEHSDNTIILDSEDVSQRPVTFTILDSTLIEVDYADEDFNFEVDGIITDDFGSYELGVQQAIAQGTLRLDYPSRIYEFASKEKFEEYIGQNGSYRDINNNELFFIINEWLPNRRSFEYESFPIRVKIKNAPNSNLFNNAIEVDPSTEDPLQLISRFAVASQSSTETNVSYEGVAIDPSAWKAIDGNNNGRLNCQIHQRGLLPVGSFSQTKTETEPWYELDLHSNRYIQYIDLWSTVELQASELETSSEHFENVYLLISDIPFGNAGLDEARSIAKYEYFIDESKRKYTLDDINIYGRYIRLQAMGVNKIELAEIEVIGKNEFTSTHVNSIQTDLFSLYPNPSNGLFSIDVQQGFNIENIKIYSLTGHLIANRNMVNKDFLNLNFELKSGAYVIVLENLEGKQVSEKLIITK